MYFFFLNYVKDKIPWFSSVDEYIPRFETITFDNISNRDNIFKDKSVSMTTEIVSHIESNAESNVIVMVIF